jgi:CRP/FNR family cyclic AMP-dependent transcriptional regulator
MTEASPRPGVRPASEPTPREISALLRQSLLFKGLQDAEVAPLVESVRIVKAKADTLLLRRGEPGDTMLIVVSGRVKIIAMSPRNTELLLSIVERGQIFGELSVLDGRERSADAVALTNVTLLSLDRASVMAFLQVRTDLLLRVLAVVCGKLRATTDMAQRSAFLPPPARLFRTLLDFAKVNGETSGEGIRVLHRLPQRELASTISSSRETVNKILQHWKKLDLVETGNGYVWIKNVAALASEVGLAGHADSLGHG